MKRSTMTAQLLMTAGAVVVAMTGLAHAILPEGLVAYYKLDAASGTVAVDETGSHDGTLTGGLTWVEGVHGNGLEFRGGNGSPFVDLGAWQTDGPGGLSLSLWAKWAGGNGLYQGTVSQREGTMYWWSEMPPDSSEVRFKSNTSPQSIVTIPNGEVVEGEWAHLAFSHDAGAGTGIAYLNGEESVRGDWSLPAGDFSGLRTGIGVVNTGDGLGTFDGVLDDVMIFDRAISVEEIAAAMAGFADPTASKPNPEDGSVDVPRDVALAWQASDTAVAHDVYFGTSFDDVQASDRANGLGVLVSEGQDGTTYDPEGLLEFGQTYYWRVDEVNGAPDNTIFVGAVWSFTVEPFAYPITDVVATSNGVSDGGNGPERTVDGSGLNAADQHSTEPTDMWLAVPGAEPLQVQYEFDGVYKLHELLVWNYNVLFEAVLGFGLKDVTVEYSEDGTAWNILGDVELAQATAAPDYAANSVVAFNGAAARYVRLTVNSGHGPMGQFGLSEVRFTFIPVKAREPQPGDGATAVAVEAALSWRVGREAATHDVYLGSDADALALVDSVDATSYAPEELEFGRTYYWRIDEVNEVEAVSLWEGDVWSFATEEFAVVEDFESYDDDENAIFDTWIDGFVNGTGSTVGYFEAPFAEQRIVHGGGQSMPLEYNNGVAPFYSEAEFDLGSADWTGNGTDTLRLFVRGESPAFAETADGSILMSAIGADIWGTSDAFRFAYKSLNGDGSIVARVDSVGNSNGWAKAGVMIRETLEPGSAHAMVVVTPSNGVAFQRRPEADAGSESTGEGGLAAPYWVKLTRAGNTFTAERSADGVTWVSITSDAAASTVEIPMGSEVLIGLALTSHDASVTTGAQFSEVSTSGGVAGQWQTADVGAEQPTGGNALETLYVALEDNAGRVAVVTHETAAVMSDWQEWQIPLSAFEGVSLGNLQMLYLGLGDRDNPSAGGAGLIFVDDIGVGHPSAVD
jgi:hypothetical protein